MNLRRLAGAAAGVLLLTAAACSDDESVFNAEVGECIVNVSDLSGNISKLPETECTKDHEAEIFFLFQHEGDDDDFPGQNALQEEAAEECLGDGFEDYMGVPSDETAIQVAMVTPSEESWKEGDRETICIAAIPGEEVDESFKDRGDDYPIEDATGGEDDSAEEFADLIASCEGGDLADCDELYFSTPVGSEAEEVGMTCGGRESDLPDNFIPGSCEETLG